MASSLSFAIVLNVVIAFGFVALAANAMTRRFPRWLKLVSVLFYFDMAARMTVGAIQQIDTGHIQLNNIIVVLLSSVLVVLVWVIVIAGGLWKQRNLITVEVEHAAWTWCVETDEVEWCDNLRVTMGVPEDVHLTRAWIHAHLHPDDKKSVWPTTAQSVDRALTFAFDYRMVREDGRIVRHVGKATPITKHGRIVAYIGVLSFELL